MASSDATPEPQSPPWFIATSDLQTLGEKRAQEQRVRTVLESLHQVFPTCTEGTLREAIAAGGDLSAVVNRLLEAQDSSARPMVAAPPPPPPPLEQMTQADDDAARLSADLASSGLGGASVPGSARASRLTDDEVFAAATGNESVESLAAQSVAQLSNAGRS